MCIFFKLSYIKSKFALTLTLNNPAKTCSHNFVAHNSQFDILDGGSKMQV